MSNECALVTTELEETWPASGEVLFLGEWCRLYSRRQQWQGREGNVLPYHWNDRKKLKADFGQLQELNRTLLLELVPVMNQLHQVDHDARYWRLLLGYWLNIYTTVLLDRWSSVERAVATGKSLRSWIIPTPATLLVADDTTDFVGLATEDPYWNHALFALLLERKVSVEKLRLTAGDRRGSSPATKRTGSTGNLLRALLKQVAGLTLYLKRSDRFAIAASHLPPVEAWALEVRLGQFPGIYWNVPAAPTCTADSAARSWRLPVPGAPDDFGTLARELLPQFIPRIFVEGYRQTRDMLGTLPWPASPAVIWTSNHHFANDVFKFWAAEKCAKGARLLIGEHGGLGTCAFNGAHGYELSIADRYLSTGWKMARQPNIVPVGNFRQVNRRQQYRADGKALLVCGNMPRYGFDARSMMLSSQVLDYIDDQFRFVAALPTRIRSGLLVRLYHIDYEWSHKERWLERYPDLVFDAGRRNIWKVAEACRLIISTYNSTTYIDSFTLNVPTVLYWNPERWEVKDEALPLFAELARVGIFHETPESAAAHVAAIWNDVEAWWTRPEVQEARMLFCRQYAASPSNSIERIESILREEAAVGSRAMAGT
jgi:putative transferase (TIGR04331 family)